MKTYKSFEFMFEVLTTIKTKVSNMCLFDYFMWEDGMYMIVHKDNDCEIIDAIRLDERETIPTGFQYDTEVTPIIRRRSL